MAAEVIRLETIGVEAVIAYFEQVQSKLDGEKTTVLSRAVKAVGQRWYDSFVSEGAAVGGWAALSDHTVKERVAHGYGAGPILHRSGSMEKVVEFFSYGSPGQFSSSDERGTDTQGLVELSNDGAVMSVGGPKAAHQEGDSHIPARPFFFVDASMEEAVGAEFINWLSTEVF